MRAFWLGLVLLSAMSTTAIAQTVPNQFQAGTAMSAAAMNQNLEFTDTLIADLREAVIVTRREQVALRGSIAAVNASSTLGPLQADNEPWRVQAGELARAAEFNDYFSRVADDLNNIDEFAKLLLREAESIHNGLLDLELAYGITTDPDFTYALTAIEPFELDVFVAGQVIDPAAINTNFQILLAAIKANNANSQVLAGVMESQLDRWAVVQDEINLPEVTYLLEQAIDLPEDALGPASHAQVAYVTQILETGQYGYRWLPAEHPISSATGQGHVSLDARDIPDQIGPDDLLRLLLGSDYTSDENTRPDTKLRLVHRIHIAQRSAVGESYPLLSHELAYLHDFENDSTAGSSTSRILFADRPLKLTATANRGERTVHVDLALRAGWNVVYWEFDSENEYVHARPFGAERPAVWQLFIPIADGTIDATVTGVSIFPSHELGAGDTHSLWAGKFHSDNYWHLQTPGWINPQDSVLVPISEALASDSVDFTGEVPADLRMVLGSVLAYGASSVGNWENDPTLSIGQLSLASEDDNEVLLVYSSKDTTVDFLLVQDDGIVSTPDVGLHLQFGWNRLEVVPVAGTTDFTIQPYPPRWEASTTIHLN